MTYPVFPSFVGMGWDVKKRLKFSTQIDKATSGSRFATARWPVPLPEFAFQFNYLSQADQETLLLFLMNLTGPLAPFLITPNNDNAVTQQFFGLGDGILTAFQLINPWKYPIYYPDAGPTVYINDWQAGISALPFARSNTCLQSQTFDNATWTKTGSSVTADSIAAPDGTTTADTLVEDGSTGQHKIQQNITPANSTPYTHSVFVKAHGRTAVRLSCGGTTGWDSGVGPSADFDLSAVTVGNFSAGSTGAIVAYPGGWYLCSLSAKTSGSSATYSFIASLLSGGVASYAGDGVSGVYLWGAQVNGGYFVERYIVTTTTTVTVTDYTLNLGLVTFAAPIATGVQVTWSGTYKFLVVFTDNSGSDHDTFELNQMLDQMYEQGGLTVETYR